MNIERLRDLREENDYKQEYVARQLGIKQQQYSEYEIGKTAISVEYLVMLADLYKTSVDYLIGRTDVREQLPIGMLYKSKIKNNEV